MSAPFRVAASSTAAVRGFLDPAHVDIGARVFQYACDRLATLAEPVTDEDARREARRLLVDMGAADLYDPVAAEDLRALCLTREAIAAASPLADAVVALQALTATPLVIAGTEAQRRRWLPSLMAGRAMGAFAMTEPEAGSDVAAMKTRAQRDGSGWRLDGEKHLISNAGLADIYVVFAVTTPAAGSRGISAFLVPADARGLTFAGAQKLAAPHPLGRLTFDGCFVAGDSVIGGVDEGFKLAMMTLDRLRPSVGAAACGIAARALDEALTYAARRTQFGQPLADFQLVRARLGCMATDLDAARLLVYRAAWEKDRGTERITTYAAMAKTFATEAAQRIVDDAVQLFGGRGVIVGEPVERLYRAVRALRIYEGATDVLRLIVGGSLVREGQE